MPFPRSLVPPAAVVAASAGLFFSGSILDQVEQGNTVARVAFLPSWPTLVGCVALAIVTVAGLGWWAAKFRHTADERPHLANLVLPLIGLAILAVPYLPVLPDRWPVLQILAGPLIGVVWLAVVGLQAWVLWGAGLIPRPAAWPRRRATAIIFAITLTVSGLAAFRLIPLLGMPGGDEPHYLVIAQSIWRDGDLDIQNNHTRGDYREYSGRELAPHYLAAGIGGVFYSVHPILMPLLMAPVYAVAGYAGVVAAFILLAAAAATLAWRWVHRALDAAAPATFAWAAIVGSAPFVLNSFTVYPEICAALAVMIAWGIMVATPPGRPGAGRHLVIGVACASLPWFSTKYAPMSAALLFVVLGRLWSNDLKALLRDPKAWAVVTPFAAALVAWFTFFWVLWGNPLPTAAYGEHGQSSPINSLRGGPGLLFDQEYGLLAFAPVYVLAVTGLVSMWRSGGDLRRQAVEIGLVFGALLGTVGAFGLWWGGSAPPGRPVVSGLFLLALPIAVAFRDARPGSARRAAHHLLLLVGVGVSVTLVAAQNGLLIDNGRDGSAALLEYWSPRWSLSTLAPTFIFHEPALASLHTVWWLAIAFATGAVLARMRVQIGAAAIAAFAAVTAALAIIALTVPLLPAGPQRPAVDLSARSRLGALDGFDARLRPLAVTYDPFQLVAPTGLLSHLTLRVTPGVRTDRLVVPLLLNGRFALSAGTYNLHVTFGDNVPSHPTRIALQVGRGGPPMRSWDLQPAPRDTWRGTIELAVDANFIGLRGPVELERAIAEITITPTHVIDASARPRVPPVLAAAQYSAAALYFHDEGAHPEPNGLWVLGRRTVSLTVAPAVGQATGPVLFMHSGGRPNTVTLSAPGWQLRQGLVPGQLARVELPAPIRGVIPLTITTADGFRPSDLDPASKDTRLLGVWVEVSPH